MKARVFALSVALLLTALQSTMLAGPAPVTDERVTNLVAILNSDAGRKEKADACRELARVGTREAIPGLAALLSNPELSHMARYGLENIPDPEVEVVLRQALGRLQGRPLVGVIGSLGVRRDTKAIKLLAPFLEDSDPEVVQATGRALGSIGTEGAADALERVVGRAPVANQPALCEGLFRCAERFASEGKRGRAVQIYDLLRSNQLWHQVRAGAVRGAIVNRKDGLSLLVQVLHSEDFSLFEAGVCTSRALAGGAVTDAMASQLAELAPDRQVVVIQALGKRRDIRAVSPLCGMAKAGTQAVRIAAIRSLAEIDDGSATPVLLSFLGEEDPLVVQAAKDALGGLSGEVVDRAVLSMLGSEHVDGRIAAADLIARRRMVSAMPALWRAAGDKDPAVRVVVVKRLAELAGPRDLKAFLTLLGQADSAEDLSATEQALSVVGLKGTQPEAAVAVLGASLADAKPVQKSALLRVLSAIGGAEALKCVRASVNETNAEVHATAIRALAAWNSVDAAPELLGLARSAEDPTDRTLCLRSYLGLAGHGEVPQEKRLSLCREAAGLVQKDDEKKLLLAALSKLGSPEALDMVKPYLDDESTRLEAGAAVVDIGQRILQGKPGAEAVAKLIEPLDKVAQTSTNADLVKRANALLEKARSQGK